MGASDEDVALVEMLANAVALLNQLDDKRAEQIEALRKHVAGLRMDLAALSNRDRGCDEAPAARRSGGRARLAAARVAVRAQAGQQRAQPRAMSELAIPEAAPATLFRTEQPDEIVERATATANALAEVIRQKQVAVRIQGREYVRVEGWTLLGTMLGVFSCLRVDAQDRGRRDARSGRDVEGRRGNPVLMFSPWAIEADPRIALAESDRVFREHLELCGLGPDDDDPEFHKEPSGEQDE